MVVLAASVISKSGKELVSRQFTDIPGTQIEGCLALFPKLVGKGKQQNYVEADNVRYLYQTIEAYYLLLVTNIQSNILQDMDTLKLLSKLVPTFVHYMDEEFIWKKIFELVFAFDEVISLGHKENVTVARVKQYFEMESHEEKEHKLELQYKINNGILAMKHKVAEFEENQLGKNQEAILHFLSRTLTLGFGGTGTSSDNDTSIFSANGGSGSGSGSGISTDVESFSCISTGHEPTVASAPPKGLSIQLGKTQKTSQLLESLKAEGEMIVEDVRPSVVQLRPAVAPPTDAVTLTAEEKLNVTLKRNGGIGNFDVHGTLSLQILNKDDELIQVQIETDGNPGVLFKTHPNIDKELFSNENILRHKDPNRPFPTGQAGGGVCLLKWRMQSTDESLVPFSVNCWPSISGDETYVSMEYEASSMFDLQNVVISVPLPALREAPNVQLIDGDWRYDSRNSILEWSIVLIDNSNRSGSMEFLVPPVDTSSFFPISVRFTATSTFSDLKVVNILPWKGGSSPKFSQKTLLSTENYQVV